MISVCLKWVTFNPSPMVAADETRHGGDTGPRPDERFGGVSPADQAALEWAVRLGELRSEPVTAVTVGPIEAIGALRLAAAAGVNRCVRIDSKISVDGVDVAAAIAGQCTDVSVIWCGDYSLDRGTGSVPAFLAALLDLPMALGAVGVDLGNGGDIEVLRRLDGGRRERLRLPGTGVISVEGSTTKLRRASLSRTLAAAAAPIETIGHTTVTSGYGPASTTSPYRPRARQLRPPVGDDPLARLRELTSTGAPSTRGETVVLEPFAAAQRIIDALTTWGYLESISAGSIGAETTV